jgi:hypothetical protein
MRGCSRFGAKMAGRRCEHDAARRAVVRQQRNGDPLAKPNYQYQKRQKELEKKKKQEEKRKKKLDSKPDDPPEAGAEGETAEGETPAT